MEAAIQNRFLAVYGIDKSWQIWRRLKDGRYSLVYADHTPARFKGNNLITSVDILREDCTAARGLRYKLYPSLRSAFEEVWLHAL